MAQLVMVGERVVSKSKEVGRIDAFENNVLFVNFGSRIARFMPDAFENGFLKYENAQLQRAAEEYIAQAKAEIARLAEEKRIVKEVPMAKKESSGRAIHIESSVVRLDAVPVTMSAVKKKDKELVREIMAKCDEQTPALYAQFHPTMEYLRYTSQARSKYNAGFLCKYLDTYVFRVFSREDIYKKRIRTGVTVTTSDTTEILRILYVNGNAYYFSKNITTAMNSLTHTTSYSNWHSTVMAYAVLLNEVIRCCDCGYLNEHIAAQNISCTHYLHLLFPALYNSKAEIVFKNRLFLSTYRIADLAGYLEEFTPKQIDFASKNDVIHTLPMIKRLGLYEPEVLKKLEMLMTERRWSGSVYHNLQLLFERLHFDLAELDRRLIHFLRRTDNFNASVYGDYIAELYRLPGVTIQDFFDNNYIERHAILSRERGIRLDAAQEEDYARIAKELSWIDREENGYFITIPKKIAEFQLEGDIQHNCVYLSGYFNRVIARQSIIVFLRKSQQTPFVTIEYDYETFAVLQALGKYNSKIDPKLYQYIVDLGKRLHYEMLSN